MVCGLIFANERKRAEIEWLRGVYLLKRQEGSAKSSSTERSDMMPAIDKLRQSCREDREDIPSRSRLTALTFEASNALLPPLCSHLR